MASTLQLAASVMALGKSGGHAGGDSPQASPPKAAAKHVARVEGWCGHVGEFKLCHPPDLVDSMPGMLLQRNVDLPGAGPSHQAITNRQNQVLAWMRQEFQGTRPKAEVIQEAREMMLNHYTAWDPEIGPQAWSLASQWLDMVGVP